MAASRAESPVSSSRRVRAPPPKDLGAASPLTPPKCLSEDLKGRERMEKADVDANGFHTRPLTIKLVNLSCRTLES